MSEEKLKEVRDVAKAAKAEVASLKNELNQLKTEVGRLKNGSKPPGGGGGGSGDANMVCNFCGQKGHRWSACPARLAAEADAKKEAAKEE